MKLTPLGEQVIEVYRTFEVEIQQQAARRLGYLKARVPKAKPTDKGAPVVHLASAFGHGVVQLALGRYQARGP